MKNVFVCHAKDDKSITKKLVSKLESSGIKCYVASRDKAAGTVDELISKSNIFILMLSKNAQKSDEVIEQLKSAVEHNCQIIPFKTGSIENNMTMQYFLHSLEWVDSYGDGFDEAYDVLLEIMEEISEGKIVKKAPKKISSKNEQEFSLQKSHLYIIIVVLSLVIIYLLFFNNDNKSTEQNINGQNSINQTQTIIDPPDFVNTDLTVDEKIIEGAWKMTDYEDSRSMSAEERKITEQNVEALKQNVLLTFNSDRVFTRAGFTPDIQKGYWEYDSKKRKIYLTPENVNQKEEINIINLTDKEMTFVVTELVQEPTGKTESVTTKITFSKQ